MPERKLLRPRETLRSTLAVVGLAVVRLELRREDSPGQHGHDVHELAYVERGSLSHHIAGRETPGPAGSLLVVPQGQVHRYRVDEAGTVLWNLLIDPLRLAAPILPEPLGRFLPDLLPPPGGSSRCLPGLDLTIALGGMLAEQQARRVGWAAGMAGHFQLVALAACRSLHAGNGSVFPAGDARLEALRRRLDDDPGHAWTLPLLAQQTGLSVSQLVRAFRSHTGRTPMAYLRGARVRAAGTHLRQGDLGLADIAQRLGYAHAPALVRAFRSETGLPPGRWLREGLSRRR